MVERVEGPWVLPAGRQILQADAPRQEWLAQRRLGIGGSDIALLLGVAHHSSQYALWEEKTGRSEGEPFNWAMQRGHWLEPGLADHFVERTGLLVRRCGLVVHGKEPRLRATPDRLTNDGGLLEVKAFRTNAKVAPEWYSGPGVAPHAYVQAQWQLLVTGRTHAWWVAYPLDEEPLIRGPIARDDALCQRMRDIAVDWWDQYVATDEPPPVDLVTVTDREIAARWPAELPGATREAQWPASVRMLLAEREGLGAAIKPLEARKKAIDQALKVMTGDAEALTVDKWPVVTLKSVANAPVVNHAMKTDLPEVWATYVKEGSSRRIHVCKGWDKPLVTTGDVGNECL